MSVHKPFKQTERTIAKRLGAQRLGHLGGADVQSDWLSCECKHRKELPAWLLEAIAQARRNATPDQLPIVALHQHGAKHADDLIVMTLADFQDWFGKMAPTA